MAPARIERNELDGGAKGREIDGKRRRRLLAAQRRFEPRMSAIDVKAVAGDVSGAEKRQSHDVVPVHVGHEDVIRLRRRRVVARERRFAERPHAAAEIAQHVIRSAGLDLDARRMTAVSPADGKVEVLDKVRRLRIIGEASPVRRA